MQRVRIHWKGRDIEVLAERIQGRLWFHLDGETHVFEPESTREKGKGTQGASDGVVAAPMPGKILRVDAKPGDKVAIGQTLVVMEAMKMEYTLAAAAAATVDTVDCAPGAQVKLGQTLVTLKDA